MNYTSLQSLVFQRFAVHVFAILGGMHRRMNGEKTNDERRARGPHLPWTTGFLARNPNATSICHARKKYMALYEPLDIVKHCGDCEKYVLPLSCQPNSLQGLSNQLGTMIMVMVVIMHLIRPSARYISSDYKNTYCLGLGLSLLTSTTQSH